MRLAVILTLLPTIVQAEAPVVAVDIAPVHGLVARVMQGEGTPILLQDEGASAHGGALRPTQAAALEGADLIVRVGEGIAPWLDGATDTLAPEAKVLVLDGHDAHDDNHAEDHDDHGHDDAHDYDDHGDDHGATHDPHGWLDPDEAADWMAAVAAALAEEDPERAARYLANAEEGRAEIEAAAAETRAVLAGFEARGILGAHDAWGHAAAAFGLTSLGGVADQYASAGSPRRLSDLREAVVATGGACALAEDAGQADRLAEQLAGTGAKVTVLDPLGAGIEPGPGFYPAFLRRMGDVLADCLR